MCGNVLTFPQFKLNWRNEMRNKLLTFAGVLMLLAVLPKLTSPLIAEVKEALLVKNIDEKGRIPYQQSGARDCTGAGLCDFGFPTVPVGKRLVIEHVSANVNANPGAGVNATFLEGAGGFTVFSLPGTSMATPELIAVNQPVLAYFESGQTPFFRVAYSSSSNTGAYSVVVSGYLVDLTQ
jgi:hypothetical protein